MSITLSLGSVTDNLLARWNGRDGVSIFGIAGRSIFGIDDIEGISILDGIAVIEGRKVTEGSKETGGMRVDIEPILGPEVIIDSIFVFASSTEYSKPYTIAADNIK